MSINHEKFFRQHGEQLLEACFYGVCGTFTVEELYQAFRERLRAEPPPSRAE